MKVPNRPRRFALASFNDASHCGGIAGAGVPGGNKAGARLSFRKVCSDGATPLDPEGPAHIEYVPLKEEHVR
jgi:hypothetical protein